MDKNIKEPDHPVRDHPALWVLVFWAGFYFMRHWAIRAMTAQMVQMVVPMMSKRVMMMDWNMVMKGGEGLMRSVPLTALVEELAARTVHPRRGDETAALESVDISLHLPHQAEFLLLAHGGQGGDDHLGVLELDQVV